MRWTVDTAKDLEFVKNVIDNLDNKEINMNNILEVLKKHPEFLEINKDIKRNDKYVQVMGSDV
jgi:spore coat polysaccharide biosynthesis protein SpsF